MSEHKMFNGDAQMLLCCPSYLRMGERQDASVRGYIFNSFHAVCGERVSSERDTQGHGEEISRSEACERISCDSTAIDAREKLVRKEKKEQDAEKERQLAVQSKSTLKENLADIPKLCDWGAKYDSNRNKIRF